MNPYAHKPGRYIAPTGFPWDWGLEPPPMPHPVLAFVQPSVGDEPARMVAVNGESQTAVPLDRKMIARLLLQLTREAAKDLER